MRIVGAACYGLKQLQSGWQFGYLARHPGNRANPIARCPKGRAGGLGLGRKRWVNVRTRRSRNGIRCLTTSPCTFFVAASREP